MNNILNQLKVLLSNKNFNYGYDDEQVYKMGEIKSDGMTYDILYNRNSVFDSPYLVVLEENGEETVFGYDTNAIVELDENAEINWISKDMKFNFIKDVMSSQIELNENDNKLKMIIQLIIIAVIATISITLGIFANFWMGISALITMTGIGISVFYKNWETSNKEKIDGLIPSYKSFISDYLKQYYKIYSAVSILGISGIILSIIIPLVINNWPF